MRLHYVGNSQTVKPTHDAEHVTVICFETLESVTKNVASVYIKTSFDVVKEPGNFSQRKRIYVCIKVCNVEMVCGSCRMTSCSVKVSSGSIHDATDFTLPNKSLSYTKSF